MLGWTILFALLSVLGAIPAAVGAGHLQASAETASAVFAILFVVFVLTRLLRRPA
jgi:hypothetical protein